MVRLVFAALEEERLLRAVQRPVEEGQPAAEKRGANRIVQQFPHRRLGVLALEEEDHVAVRQEDRLPLGDRFVVLLVRSFLEQLQGPLTRFGLQCREQNDALLHAAKSTSEAPGDRPAGRRRFCVSFVLLLVADGSNRDRDVGVVGEDPVNAKAIEEPELRWEVTGRLHVDGARGIALAEVLRQE